MYWALALRLTLATPSIVGGNSTTATLALAAAAPAGGAVVSIAFPAGITLHAGANRVGIIQQEGVSVVRVPAGALSITIDVLTAGVAVSTPAVLTATSGIEVATATLTVTPASVRSLTIAPTGVTGGQLATLTIALDGAAPSGGLTIPLAAFAGSALTQNDGSVRAIGPVQSLPLVPATATVPPGTRALSLTVATSPVAQNTSFAIRTPEAQTAATTIVVNAPVATRVQLSPDTVLAGSVANGSVTLSGAAPASGTSVALFAQGNGATVPTVAAVPAGATSVSFAIPTAAATGSATSRIIVGIRGQQVSAPSHVLDGTSNTIGFGEGGSTISDTMTIVAPSVASFTLRPLTVFGGRNVIASLVLLASASTSAVVALSTDRPDLVVLPASITVPVSSVPTPFTVKTLPVSAQTTATVTAAAGPQRISIVLTLVP